MRRFLCLTLLLAHCAPVPAPRPVIQPAPTSLPHAAAAPPLQPAAPRFHGQRQDGITFQGVDFDSRSHRLVIVDQPAGPGSIHADARRAAASRRGIAAINGGFFAPDGQPLGRVTSDGQSAGHWNDASSLCSGSYLVEARGRAAIRSRRTMRTGPPGRFLELLQSGPMLIRDRQPVRGLDREKRAQRSFLLWDGMHRWWMGRSSACTLAELARTIHFHSPAGWPVAQALNLDGGSSSELWVSRAIRGGPHHSSHWWLKPARNYLVLIAGEIPLKDSGGDR